MTPLLAFLLLALFADPASYGPGQKNLDLSVVRFIPIRETVRGELRAGPRVIQFAFKLSF